jgi:hypothetical protein
MNRILRCRWKVGFFAVLTGIFLNESVSTIARAAEAFAPLEQMNSATAAVLMIIQPGIAFRVAVTEQKLPEVSCVYEVKSSDGSFGNLVQILQNNIISFAPNRETFEARIGIIIKKDSSVLGELYFQDFGGAHKVRGRFARYGMLASAELPERLRSLAFNKDVKLIRDSGYNCPHS